MRTGLSEGFNLKSSGIPSEEEYLRCYISHLDTAGKIPEKLMKSAVLLVSLQIAACFFHHLVCTVNDSGLPHNWDFFLAFSFFRSAAILQVRGRSLPVAVCRCCVRIRRECTSEPWRALRALRMRLWLGSWRRIWRSLLGNMRAHTSRWKPDPVPMSV